mgnify:CR=1 FL=1
MEFYNFRKEINVKDININQKILDLPKNMTDIIYLEKAIRNEPDKLALLVIKPLNIKDFEMIKNWMIIKYSDIQFIFASQKILTPMQVEILYNDMVQDKIFLPKIKKFLSAYQTLFVVIKGLNCNTQERINHLKEIRVNGKRQDGELRAYLRGAKYCYAVYKRWLEGEKNAYNKVFDDNTQNLLSRNYILGNGIHTPDTNEEAVQVIKSLLLV